MKIFAQQNDTVDALCWRYYQRTEGVTEQIFACNLGLADAGVTLPHGYRVDMPDPTPSPLKQHLQLWD